MEEARILLSPPDIGNLEFVAFERVFESGWFAPAGPELDSFESEVAELSDRKYAVALGSGTAALHLALIAAGVKKGDLVLCSTLTFVATANAIAYIGAIPVFVDSEVSSGNMSPHLLQASLEECARDGFLPSAIVLVDFLGKMANYPAVLEIASKWGIPLISDSAESLGSTLGMHPAGSFGDSAIFSFNGNKIVTSSGGGMFVTNDKHAAEMVRFLSTQARADHPYYHHEHLGYNYRLSNVLAAIGRAQLGRLQEFVQKRRQHRVAYLEFFSHVEGVEVFGGDSLEDNCWLTAVLIDDSLSWRPEDLANYLLTKGIETRHLWKPMHSQPLYESNRAFVDGSADHIFERGLALPSGSKMGDAGRERVINEIKGFLWSVN